MTDDRPMMVRVSVARANASFAASGWDDLTATEAIPYTL